MIEYQDYMGFGNYNVESSPSQRSYTKRVWMQETYVPKDNNCKITYCYYKNKNGENHVSLPRSWVGSDYVVDKVTKNIYPDGEDGALSTDYRLWKEEHKSANGLPKDFVDQNGDTQFYQPLHHLLKA